MQVGYLIECSMNQFASGDSLLSYTRITPQGGEPVLMGEIFEIPPIPSEMVSKLTHKALSRLEIGMSGAFSTGEGQYSVELLLVDRKDRRYRKQWTVKAVHPHKDKSVPLALKPNQVEALMATPWDGKLAGDGVRLTVLLHATPMNPRAAKLYVWDRAFLLQSLISLLKQMPCQSVRVIAFNLDQQQEIFRQEQFDGEGFEKLSRVLRKLELGTVSYKALQRNTWAESLARMTREEATAKNPSDAVVFLGPTSHFWDKVPREMMSNVESGPKFFYVEYFPWAGYEFPDAIDNLTRNLNGTVFRIHSADQLGQAIQKMLGQIKPAQNSVGWAPRPPEQAERSEPATD